MNRRKHAQSRDTSAFNTCIKTSSFQVTVLVVFCARLSQKPTKTIPRSWKIAEIAEAVVVVDLFCCGTMNPKIRPPSLVVCPYNDLNIGRDLSIYGGQGEGEKAGKDYKGRRGELEVNPHKTRTHTL